MAVLVPKPLVPVQKLVNPFIGLSWKGNWFIAILGSNVIVAGTAIFGADNPTAVIEQLKNTVNTAQAKFAN